MSIKCSPLNGAALIPPSALPAALVRADAFRRSIHGLGSAFVPVTLVWPLYEAVSTWEQEGERGCSLFRWPTSLPFAPSRLRTARLCRLLS